ncbi:MAG TPA: aminotransferase class V-fold PLP-dependent enzyme, partial [Chthonomonadales bacterium]|nr:aminotransferase class V-fold PLP-dependent enzyme [Chthonomonadales bacterium]
MAAMLPLLTSCFGNPSSVHSFGSASRAAVDLARESVAGLLRAEFSEIYFTSGGTEADNLALTGAMEAAAPGRDHLVTTAIEHPAVRQTAAALRQRGYSISFASVDRRGLVSLEDLQRLIT